MRSLRKEDLSLHHYIKNVALREFIETEYNIPLNYLSDTSVSGSHIYESVSPMTPSPTSKGRGWVYTDNANDVVEQTSSVIVYDSLDAVISGSNYMVDYVDGRVIFDADTYDPATVTYNWNYVAVVDDWEYVQTTGVPAVVIDIADFIKEGFQLGGGKKVPRTVNLSVFAATRASRDDITEALFDSVYLKRSQFQEFSKGTMIDWDGTFNTAYEFTTVSGSSALKFDGIVSKNITPPLLSIPNNDLTMLSDLNRYRSRITFTMFHHDESY